MDCYVEQSWLEAVAGTDFFYPAAWMDVPPFISLLAPHISHFVCNDLNYNSRVDGNSLVPNGWRLVSECAPERKTRDMQMEQRGTESRVAYRHIEPSTFEQRYTNGQAELTIVRRRGFGQIALVERKERSIGAFVHRHDSTGESGSNVWFLANRRKAHAPLADLWDKLSVRLADRALVISDGSLTTFKFLDCPRDKRFLPFYEAQRRASPFQHEGFMWQCAGYMNDRGGALIWGLLRL